MWLQLSCECSWAALSAGNAGLLWKLLLPSRSVRGSIVSLLEDLQLSFDFGE